MYYCLGYRMNEHSSETIAIASLQAALGKESESVSNRAFLDNLIEKHNIDDVNVGRLFYI